MKVTILQDTKTVGKTKSGTKHPIKGLTIQREFKSAKDFESIIHSLKPNECLTIGLYPDNYHYVPSTSLNDLSKPRHITRTKANASPGHLLLIDCDFPEFHHMMGPQLHQFLEQYLPDIFGGAEYLTTNSTSHYTKGKKAFHQYYFFKNPADFTQIFILLDKLFKAHNILTYSLASNYSRTYIKTPIDTKLCELQMPVFEASNERLKGLDLETNDIQTTTYPGHIIDTTLLSLPSVDTSQAQPNSDRIMAQAEHERTEKLIRYLTAHGSDNPTKDSKLLERQTLPASLTIVGTHPGEKQNLVETTILNEIINLLQTEKAPTELYRAIGEPEYASRQTAKLFFNTSYDLGSYTIVDQAHGGTNYQIIFTYDDIDSILSLSKQLQPIKLIKLLTARNELNGDEAQLLGQLHARKGVITASQMAKALMSADWVPPIEEQICTLTHENVHTSLAAIDRARIDLSKSEKLSIDNGTDVDRLFKADNIEIIQSSVFGMGRDDIMLKPGPNHEFNISPRAKIVKQLAPIYPATNISPYADEVVIDALVQKFTSTNKVDSISYKASMHGERLFFGDGQVEITYQQARPTFQNVPTPIKHTLDTISSSTYSEFRDMYMNHSLGQIWDTVSELSYIKKVNPQLKKDFLHLHLPSDAGKSFNMDIANIITPYEKTSLDQFFEQAAKINPINIAKSAFLFHDEVKSFHHQWNELGAYYSIKQAYAQNSILTQLPLKILASKENVMGKGTEQQYNRLMVMSPDIGPYKALNIAPEHEVFMTAVTYKCIYDAFTQSYDKYANLPEQKALQLAYTVGNAYSVSLSSKDMVITGDYITDTIVSYLVQELVDYGSNTVMPSLIIQDGGLSRYIKVVSLKNNILHISFKKQTLSNFIEFILRETTGSIEARSMNYEALSMTWADIGCYKLDKSATKGGQSGFYGNCMDIPLGVKK